MCSANLASAGAAPRNEIGRDRLWLWFSLSRASWLTLPRVLLHEMPDDWQNKMAELLEIYEQTFVNWPNGIGTRVQITDGGKLSGQHKWLNNYRYPAQSKIAALRASAAMNDQPVNECEPERPEAVNLPCHLACPKCGSGSIQRLHRVLGQFVNAGFLERTAPKPPFLKMEEGNGWSAVEEHLNHHCRECHYDWQTAVLHTPVIEVQL